jgi:hypothetical protein
MALFGVTIPANYEVAIYTLLVLLLWLLIRFIASSMNKLLNLFREPELVVEPFLNGVVYPVSYWTEKGKRPYQEDRFHITKSGSHPISLYGVFDGHGGSRASEHCRNNLLNSLADDDNWKHDPCQSIINTFRRSYYFSINFRKYNDLKYVIS